MRGRRFWECSTKLTHINVCRASVRDKRALANSNVAFAAWGMFGKILSWPHGKSNRYFVPPEAATGWQTSGWENKA
jgi:hypothetical protein